jgi:hypothetical protein
VSELILLEHLRLDERLHGIYLAIATLLHKLDFTEGTLADNLNGCVILGLLLGAQEPQVLSLLAAGC